MNKRDLIDSFESLTPSDSQKEKMLSNVLSHGMKKNIHKVSFNFRYAFSTVAAAVCVLAVVVSVGPMYEYYKLSQDDPAVVTDEVEIPSSDDVESTEQTEKDANSSVNDNTLPHMAVENTTTESTESEQSNQVNEAVASEEKTADEHNVGKSGRMLMVDDLVPAYTPELNINPLNGGGGGAAPHDEYSQGYEELTLDQYYQYLGVYVEYLLDIPEGFENTTKTVDRINKVTDDAWYFEYKKGDSTIGVTTTKVNVGSYLNLINDSSYVLTDINGTESVVMGNGAHYKAYIVTNDIGYMIDTVNVSEDDLANLLLSIAG